MTGKAAPLPTQRDKEDWAHTGAPSKRAMVNRQGRAKKKQAINGELHSNDNHAATGDTQGTPRERERGGQGHRAQPRNTQKCGCEGRERYAHTHDRGGGMTEARTDQRNTAGRKHARTYQLPRFKLSSDKRPPPARRCAQQKHKDSHCRRGQLQQKGETNTRADDCRQ